MSRTHSVLNVVLDALFSQGKRHLVTTCVIGRSEARERGDAFTHEELLRDFKDNMYAMKNARDALRELPNVFILKRVECVRNLLQGINVAWVANAAQEQAIFADVNWTVVGSWCQNLTSWLNTLEQQQQPIGTTPETLLLYSLICIFDVLCISPYIRQQLGLSVQDQRTEYSHADMEMLSTTIRDFANSVSQQTYLDKTPLFFFVAAIATRLCSSHYELDARENSVYAVIPLSLLVGDIFYEFNAAFSTFFTINSIIHTTKPGYNLQPLLHNEEWLREDEFLHASDFSDDDYSDDRGLMEN
jgi:hypothetical protein